jgi:hypothetical protein
MLCFIVLNDNTLSAACLSNFMLSVFMTIADMSNVLMLNGIVLNVVAPFDLVMIHVPVVTTFYHKYS